MKIKVTTIDFEISRRAKRRAILIGVPLAIILGAGALGYAGPPTTFSAGDVLSSAKVNANFAGLDMRLSMLEAVPGIPAGTIIAFAGTTAPAGWLPCDGTSLDGTNATYTALYAAVGTAYGGNTTSKAFNLPDLRGRFVRGWDHGAGHDPDAAGRTTSAAGGKAGDAVGSVEADSLGSHAHGVNDPGHTHPAPAEYNGQNVPAGGFYYAGSPGAPGNGAATGVAVTGISIQSTGGAETRPANVSVNYIIKL